MSSPKNSTKSFSQGLKKLGFEGDDLLFLVNEQKLPDPLLKFHLETAENLGATAVYFRLQLNGIYKPQVYLFDFTAKNLAEEDNSIANIQTNLWSSGEVPLACFFFNTEIKIVDCTKHVTKKFTPEYLISSLNLVGKADDLYNEQFAVKIKTGLFWEQEELKKKFKFQNSAYDTLIKNIRNVSEKLKSTFSVESPTLINKIIVQAILIKYLEERSDNNGEKLLSEKYFKKYDNASTFNEVLRNKGKFVDLLLDLNKDFNGNVFTWTETERKQLQSLDLNILADFLSTDKTDISSQQAELEFNLRYFEFKYIPVELISRLYEEFLGEDKQEKGLFYTPSHLAKLLVDECLPLKKYEEINIKDFKILDPACGSGIFLVVAFKRLVQIWRLQNEMKHPDIKDLKPLLKNIYGVDKEEQAIKLASFSLSLALCNELNPMQIIDELRFDDLTVENLIESDFFQCDVIKDKKFDLIIGNPPFKRGAISNYSNKWELENKKITIPQGQIALKFLSKSFSYLREGGLSCLIIKSSGLLYNSTSNDYKRALFSNYNVVQIFDFTALARNSSLWDGADVASAAVFVKNEKPDFSKNLLHLTFRRTIATKERIFFEIDDYDFHFINRQTAINNEFVWKCNLLGGGRINNFLEKVEEFDLFKLFLQNNGFYAQEGHGTLKNKVKNPTQINKRLLSLNGIVDKKIDFDKTELISNLEQEKINDVPVYHIPSLIVSETIVIDKAVINIALNDKENLVFKNRYIGISSENKRDLENIFDNFCNNEIFYILQFIIKSAQLLINRNTAILAYDLYNLRYISNNNLSDFDNNIAKDVISFFQEYLRIGEKSRAVKSIKGEKNIKSIIGNYGVEFSRALNIVYGEGSERKFRLSDVVELDNSLIATVFKFDTENAQPIFHKDLAELNIESLTDNVISEQLSIKRIIKLYPQKDTIVFIKPNQYRYWLSLTAYRDADKCFSDFSNAGF